MNIEKLVRIWRGQWEAVVGGQGVTPLFDVNNEY